MTAGLLNPNQQRHLVASLALLLEDLDGLAATLPEEPRGPLWRLLARLHDLHATILNQLGIDHTRLTYRYAGRDFRLTDVFGDVVKDILV